MLLGNASVMVLVTAVACEKMQAVITRTLGSVQSIEVSPSVAHVGLGQKIQLTAVAKGSNGLPLEGRDVVWSSSNPSVVAVDDSGLVVTVGAGSATISATSDDKSGTSSVTVSAAGPTGTHEPPGLTLINEQPWDCIACNGWSYRAEYGSSDIQADPAAPKSPANELRVVFPTSMPRDNGPGNHWLSLARPYRWHELYVAYWIKWGDPWDALNQGAKVSFLWAQSGSYVYAVQVAGTPPYHIGMVVGWSPYGYGYGDGGVWHPNVTRTPILTGQWYFVEEHFKYPTTPGGSDGIIRWWVNGTLNGDFTNVTYPADAGFVQFEFPFTRQARPLLPSYVYVDDTRVSGNP